MTTYGKIIFDNAEAKICVGSSFPKPSSSEDLLEFLGWIPRPPSSGERLDLWEELAELGKNAHFYFVVMMQLLDVMCK